MTVTDRHELSARWLITEAFTALLSAMPFEKISVHAIVHKAGISRSTFYLHYQDKFDLLEQMTESITGQLLAVYEARMTEEQLQTVKAYEGQIPIPATVIICDHIRNHERFYRNRFQDPRFTSWLNNELLERFQRIYENDAQAAFAAGGTLAYMGRWLLNGLPGTSLESAQQLCRLAMLSLSDGHAWKEPTIDTMKV
ncbi:TetR family transcriptional regulator [Paenibacillus cellulosilyticus]|uniref:TetR family transcriptional regulator n=1 Tax=Paenibacillus cellulosilyticus TaxID=375489 RepID=A0A2V2YRJ2_9BACL|nr:TetR/AcrR family transcriptional regulator [Paenibacillus cellulosilyticus]PWV99530.1 TetR family transcriptional regulator [Paenibacillus cellulosilyticus]QKS44780.1 TetR family transcriptional regulator [Paenibacillus cellulosilyticus]